MLYQAVTSCLPAPFCLYRVISFNIGKNRIDEIEMEIEMIEKEIEIQIDVDVEGPS